MALLVLCGLPCSGKSAAAAQLSAALAQLGLRVCVIDEPSLHIARDAGYADAVAEKRTRGLLRSAVQRVVGHDTYVILDSLNFIKGYRYELYCVARAASIRYSVLWCAVDTVAARAANERAVAAGAPHWSAAALADLAARFEPPNAANRWDAPLFTWRPDLGLPPPPPPPVPALAPAVNRGRPAAFVRAGASVATKVVTVKPDTGGSAPGDCPPLAAVAIDSVRDWAAGGSASSEPPADPTGIITWPDDDTRVLPAAAVIAALTGGAGHGLRGGGRESQRDDVDTISDSGWTDRSRGGAAVAPSSQLTEGPATAATRLPPPELLYELDRAAGGVVAAILGGGGAASRLVRPVGAAELRRHHRDWLRLATAGAGGDAAGAAGRFEEYLERMIA